MLTPIRLIQRFKCGDPIGIAVLAFGAETAQNTVKSEKTGFGMVVETVPGPVFCIFRPKIPRTFWGKCTEQSRRKKLAEGGFEPCNA